MSAPLAISAADLPAVVWTRDGASFDPNEVRWRIREGSVEVSLNFSRVIGAATSTFVLGFRKTLIWYGERHSLMHMHNMFRRAEHFFKYLDGRRRKTLGEVSGKDLINYRSSLAKHELWYVGAIAGFVRQWHALGYPGIAPEAIALLAELRLPGNEKGTAVRTMDSHDGPLTDIEMESLQVALNRAYAFARVSKADFLLAWLFMLLGQRPKQYAELKLLDFSVIRAKDGSASYCLRVPRVKQRKPSRQEFKDRLITPQIGQLLTEYVIDMAKSFEGKLRDPFQAPLFPQNESGEQPRGMEYHQTASELANTLVRTLDALEVSSERTGDFIHITATRFRRTTGTRAAQEGHGELVIAELLDHTDTQHVGIYVESTPEIVKRIDKAVAFSLAPLAQAFEGVIIVDESEDLRRDDPSSKVFDPRIEPSCKAMGSCGRHGFCGFLAPIACYTCYSFQAWLDGPHEAVLEYLLNERERKMAITDPRIASINDRTILAVAAVIQECAAIRVAGRGEQDE